MTNHTIPAGYYVRYDYHEKPVAITAVLFNHKGATVAVGVAKFSARDPYFSFETGEQIALGRALRHLKDGYGLGRAPRVDLGELTPLAQDKVPGYISVNLTEPNTDYLNRNTRQIMSGYRRPQRATWDDESR